MARPSLRKMRRADFEAFHRSAREVFARIAAADPRNAFFDGVYRLRVTPGGAMCGHDQRSVEVFYGSRPIEAVEEFVAREGREPRLQERFLAEHGACLFYQRMDSGIVLVGLRPAGTENYRRREEIIQLEWIWAPDVLRGRAAPERHWRAFVSYMEYTSLEGEPTMIDRLRVWWLLFARPTVVDGKHCTARCWTVGATVVRFALTIGLSGFLLAIVQALMATPPSPH
ncbi:hypothetical protein ASF22_19625 [Methylobacterium sp. Leaf87]|uniref:hypothetical protein n=1 Tax=Methylobacterium sp. Leaf87 TaxID=1736243 RepID=UPI0006F853D9|nr:hypothetical protein [Methylobacterium sp. Leaf87]KQO68768.1 hypothetical protein ASF22_19625 [Methylobacterium sp. Leaf87]